MNSRSLIRNLAVLSAVASMACTALLAGGPLAIYDPATKTPYSWHGGYAPVYTDLGTLGVLTNEQADAMFRFSVNQWNTVPTSSFHGAIVGDFSSLGLPDVDSSNLGLVLGTWNGGGVHVIYDADGSIITSLFGSPYGILGVTITEYVGANSPDILEVTMILNGTALPDWVTPEEAAAMYAGVTTHEFGHAIGLAHTQTNGQLILGYDMDIGPAGCPTPYTAYPTNDDMETMYPFTNLSATGVAESTVDVLDDEAALSDIYPKSGWPGRYPAIMGTIYLPQRSWCRRAPQMTGTNVIARNVANPYKDAISAISGDHTEGLAGPDGTYAFHGLTSGASYVVYVDGLLFGAFSTPSPTVLPGPEEYWNGFQESGDGVRDQRCNWTMIRPSSRRPTVADITFNQVKGAPEFIPVDLPMSPVTELSGDGRSAVGAWEGGIFRWTPTTGVTDIGGDYRSPQAGISHDGRTITASVPDAAGLMNAAIYRDGGWMTIGPGPNSASCDIDLTSGWGVSDNQTVVGLDWLGCTATSAFKWNRATGWQDLGYLGTDYGGSRADRISADASTVVGWDSAGFWRGAIWRNNQETIITQPPALCCDWDPVGCISSEVGEASGVNPNGSIVVGQYYSVPHVYTDPDTGDQSHYCSSTGWKWTASGGAQPLGDFLPDYSPSAIDLSDDGGVIVGVADPIDWYLPRKAVIWTEATGFMDFQDFLEKQGTWATDWLLQVAGTVSGDGRTVGGFGYSPLSAQGFIVQMPRVVICHTPRGHHMRKQTIDVAWPNDLAAHLAHGDTIGMCGNGM